MKRAIQLLRETINSTNGHPFFVDEDAKTIRALIKRLTSEVDDSPECESCSLHKPLNKDGLCRSCSKLARQSHGVR